MGPPPKAQTSGTLPSVVLSNLPENVIDDILIRLPLRDAVKTSILSRKWRYKWYRLPELNLDPTLWGTTNVMQSTIIRFTDVIYHLLTLHVGPITKFTLSIPNMGKCPKVDHLMCFLSKHGIEHLVLKSLKDNPYKVPSSFFNCLQMRHLTLHYCSINIPISFNGFQKLVSLELCKVSILSYQLESLISQSPLLEQVMLKSLHYMGHIHIKAPKLRSFEFSGSIKSISLKTSPLLVKLSLLLDDPKLRFFGSFVNVSPNDLTKYFESFPALEHLHLNNYSLQVLTAGVGDIPAKLSSPLCLKCLSLSDIRLDDFTKLSYALCLIRSSPYLQDIQMKVYASDPLPGNVIIDQITAGFSDVTLTYLRAVKLEGITGTRPQMQLIKILLAKSPMLLRMVTQPLKHGNVSFETRLKILEEMITFPRASPRAEVYYK